MEASSAVTSTLMMFAPTERATWNPVVFVSASVSAVPALFWIS